MRGVRFKVWEHGGSFYAHLIGGNNQTSWACTAGNDGFNAGAAGAFKACTSTWNNIGRAMGMDPKGINFPPVPYTKDSLKPRLREVS